MLRFLCFLLLNINPPNCETLHQELARGVIRTFPTTATQEGLARV
jgi:hypothetical protein